jgi:hypothetical protein
MSSTTVKKPDALAALIVYGRLDGVELPQAAWFRKEDSQTAATAAASLKLSTIKLVSADDAALAEGVSEGSVKSSGRILLGSVATEIYRRLEERGRAIAPTGNGNGKNHAKHSNLAPGDAWDKVQPGSVVLAAYWDNKSRPAGWWPAVVIKVCDTGYVLRWHDTPNIPLGKVKRKFVAILHTEFLETLK